MSKILKLVEKHFWDGKFPTSFDYRDFSSVTGINGKVCAMNLKRLRNNERLGSFVRCNSGGTYCDIYYFYRTKEQINEAVEETNATIDKYNLKQKKLKKVE